MRCIIFSYAKNKTHLFHFLKRYYSLNCKTTTQLYIFCQEHNDKFRKLIVIEFFNEFIHKLCSLTNSLKSSLFMRLIFEFTNYQVELCVPYFILDNL